MNWSITIQIGQLILLVVNALLVWRYVSSTEKIKDAAVQQANSASEQARHAADQVEGVSRPVIVIDGNSSIMALLNIGNGPALNLKWWVWSTDVANLPWPGAPTGRLPYLESRQKRELVTSNDILGQKLLVRYESASGRRYRSEGLLHRDTMVGEWFEHSVFEESREFLEREMEHGRSHGADR